MSNNIITNELTNDIILGEMQEFDPTFNQEDNDELNNLTYEEFTSRATDCLNLRNKYTAVLETIALLYKYLYRQPGLRNVFLTLANYIDILERQHISFLKADENNKKLSKAETYRLKKLCNYYHGGFVDTDSVSMKGFSRSYDCSDIFNSLTPKTPNLELISNKKHFLFRSSINLFYFVRHNLHGDIDGLKTAAGLNYDEESELFTNYLDKHPQMCYIARFVYFVVTGKEKVRDLADGSTCYTVEYDADDTYIKRCIAELKLAGDTLYNDDVFCQEIVEIAEFIFACSTPCTTPTTY